MFQVLFLHVRAHFQNLIVSFCFLFFIIYFYSLAVHPNKELFATGQIGKDPFICVWNSKTMEMVSILQGGHERGIATLAFSGDGEVRACNMLFF